MMRLDIIITSIMMLIGCTPSQHNRPPQDLVQICEIRGVTYHCYYVTRDELERAVREAQGQH